MTLMGMNIQEAEPVSREQKLAINQDRQQTQAVLYEVFPKHIADALKVGRKVEPETHEMVTVSGLVAPIKNLDWISNQVAGPKITFLQIFFSDIVGFTSISQTMPPIKVSQMLERLYNRFDKLARAYKVFKVETIGDAWYAMSSSFRFVTLAFISSFV
jgi:guanylate cyclase, other